MDAVSRSKLGGVPADAATAILSFEEVYARHAETIYRFCVVQMRDPTVAEDVTGDTFVKAFAAYERVRPAPEDVKFWLLRIARNTGIDHQRRARRAALFTRLRHNEPSVDIEQTVQLRHDLRMVIMAAGALSQRDRELVALRASGLSFSEIATALGMQTESAGVATRRAMEKLRHQAEGLQI
jgi:RNA polymerase sigma-70 factor (ECF subfamily)